MGVCQLSQVTVRLPEKGHIETSMLDETILSTILKAETLVEGLWVRNPKPTWTYNALSGHRSSNRTISRLYVHVDWGHKDVSREGTTPEASPHLFLCGIPISIFMKVSEAKERQGRYLREMPRRLV